MNNKDKFEGRWYWCHTCQTPAVYCLDCGNSSCNGSSCDKCHDDVEAIMLLSEEERPKKEDIPHTTKQIQDFKDNESRKKGWTEEQIEARHKDWEQSIKDWEEITGKKWSDE